MAPAQESDWPIVKVQWEMLLHGACRSNTVEYKPPEVLVWRRSAGGVPHNLSQGLHSTVLRPKYLLDLNAPHDDPDPLRSSGVIFRNQIICLFCSPPPQLPDHLSAAMALSAFKSVLNCIGTYSFLSFFTHTFILLWSSMTLTCNFNVILNS